MLKRKKLAGYVRSDGLSDGLKKEIRAVLHDNKVMLPGWSPTFLASLGHFDNVIDIGVLEGTPELYKAFPEAQLILVEALPMYEEACHRIMEGRSGQIHMCAVGAIDGSATIRHYPTIPARSSLLDTYTSNELEFEEIKVPLRRLDTLLNPAELVGSTILKIDVEGMELEVLRGATELLGQIQYIIAETSVKQRHKNSYRFADLVAFLSGHGFHLYDALRLTRTKALISGASIMDAIFINERLPRN